MKLPCWNPREPSEADMRCSNVPRSKWNADLEQIREMPYYKCISEYISNLKDNCERGIGLLLTGPYRSGKSSIAALAVREMARHRCTPYWLEAFELVDGWFEKENRYDMARSSHLLVVDDLGMESEDENNVTRRSIIKQILRYRLERERPVIITTNMSMKKILEVYKEKMMTLLTEYMHLVVVEGKSWEGKI